MNKAQHPQSDADFLSESSIALKGARESENCFVCSLTTDIFGFLVF